MADLEQPFVRVLHPDALKALTDSPSFERGERYFREGRVGELTRQAGAIKATVSGTTPYEVRIFVRGDQLAYSCTCPSAGEGFFCKHCVAVALAWLRSEPEVPRSGAGSAKPSVGERSPGESHSLGQGGAAPSEREQPSMNESHAGLKAPVEEKKKEPSEPPARKAVAKKPDDPQLRLDVTARWEPGRVHAFLRKQDPAMLADLLLDQAERDPALKDALMKLLAR